LLERAPHASSLGHLVAAFAALHQSPPPLPISDGGLAAIDDVFWVFIMLLCLSFMCLFLGFFVATSFCLPLFWCLGS
jgi:hypothetical protein